MDKLEQFKKRLDSNFELDADNFACGVEPMDVGNFVKKEMKKSYGEKKAAMVGYENCTKAEAPLNSIENTINETRNMVNDYEKNLTRFLGVLEKLNTNCIYNMEDSLKEWMTRKDAKAITSGLISDHNRLNDSLNENNIIFELALNQFEQLV